MTKQEETGKLKKRVLALYDAFNNRKWQSCFEFLDPALRDGRINYDIYMDCLIKAHQKYGQIKCESLKLILHLDTKTALYNKQDFAYGLLEWEDKHGKSHVFKERWVKTEGNWHTRMTGLI